MLLDVLKDFEWLNEPRKLAYSDAGMAISTEAQTDFWQSVQHQVRKDNGHFFFTPRDGNFTLTLQWQFGDYSGFRQCGLMLRLDERNWIKMGLMAAEAGKPQIGTVVTHRGNSDWAVHDLPESGNVLWFRVRRLKGDYIFFVSVDGEKFRQLRLVTFHSENPVIQAGAYACSPQEQPFDCTLKTLDFCSD